MAEVRSAVRPYLTGPVLVACSGGADSLALAAAVAFEAPRAGVTAGLITIDHGLQDGSADQAARVAALGCELGFDPVEVIRVTVGRTDPGVAAPLVGLPPTMRADLQGEPGGSTYPGGLEAAARSARYVALSEAAEALGARVLLGHTLDDQAETVLLGLGRGSGPRSIAGMRPVQPPYVRPFLSVRRATTEAACAALALDRWDDPHNADRRFRRVRIRTELLPLMEDVLGGGVAEALARTAELTRDDLDALAELTPRTVDVDELATLPRALRTRALRAWIGGQLTFEHLRAVDALITDWHGQGPVDLPGGRRVRRESGKLQM